MASHPDFENADRVPILVGIIGHRDILPEKTEENEAKVRAALIALKKQFRNTPFFLVCSLAEGADMLGAKIAIELDMPLVALLPMEPAEYKKTFMHAASGPLLDSYLERAEVKHVCTSFDNPSNPGSLDDQFARSGAAVMQYSHIVIALWDGVTRDFAAGTSFLVRHAIKGIPRDIVYDLEGSSVSPLDPVSTALVRRIPVERVSNSVIETPVFEDDLPPGKFADIEFKGENFKSANLKLRKSQKKMLQHFDQFNKDAKRYKPKSGNWCDALGYPPLVTNEKAAKLNSGLNYMRERFALADSLAIHFHKNRHVICVNLVLLFTSLIAFVHQIISSKIEIHQILSIPPETEKKFLFSDYINFHTGWPFLIYGLLIAMAFATVYIFRGKRWRERYLDYRTIAEAARIQFFWHLSGIRPPVVHSFLRKQQDELEWIRSVVRLWYLRAVTQGGLVKNASVEEAQLIEDNWITDQLVYNEKTAKKHRRKNNRLKFLSASLLVVLLATVVLNSLEVSDKTWFTIPENGWRKEVDVKTNHLLTVFGALAGAGALLVSSLRHFFGINELQKSTERMQLLYKNANRVYEPRDGIQDHERELLMDLGRESLTETGDWLLMNRKRKVKVRR